MAVPDRNRILFRRVFRAHHWVWRGVALSFRLERGSYALRRRIRYSYIYIARMSPTLSRSSALLCVKLGDALEIRTWIIFDFYSGLPHLYTKQNNFYLTHSKISMNIIILGVQISEYLDNWSSDKWLPTIHWKWGERRIVEVWGVGRASAKYKYWSPDKWLPTVSTRVSFFFFLSVKLTTLTSQMFWSP